MSPSAVLLPDTGGRGGGGGRGGAWQKINGKWQTAPAPALAQCEAGGAGSDNSSDNTEERSVDIQAQQTVCSRANILLFRYMG